MAQVVVVNNIVGCLDDVKTNPEFVWLSVPGKRPGRPPANLIVGKQFLKIALSSGIDASDAADAGIQAAMHSCLEVAEGLLKYRRQMSLSTDFAFWLASGLKEVQNLPCSAPLLKLVLLSTSSNS